MCGQDRPEEDEYGIRIHAGRYSDAYLLRASWHLGYTIVMWRGRHIPEPTELSAETPISCRGSRRTRRRAVHFPSRKGSGPSSPEETLRRDGSALRALI